MRAAQREFDEEIRRKPHVGTNSEKLLFGIGGYDIIDLKFLQMKGKNHG